MYKSLPWNTANTALAPPHTCTHISTHTYTHAHTHAHTHTCTHNQASTKCHYYHHHHLFLNHRGGWGTTNDFTTSFLYFTLFSTAMRWWTPGPSIPWCYFRPSFSVCLVFFPLSLCLARWFWPDLMNERHVHTTSVCVSLQWSGGLRVVWLPAWSWHRLPRW